MNFETCFQLQNPKRKSSKNPIIANVVVGKDTITIDLNLFILFSKNIPNNKNTDSNLVDLFTKSYYEAVKKLKVKDENSKLFLNIINGKQTTFNSTNFFDIFKLSKYFKIPELLTFLDKTCQMIKDTNLIYSVLQKGQISKEENEYFIKFLSCGQMKAKLSEKINECFELYFFTPEFPINAIFEILESCKSIDSIPVDKLYQLIIQSFDNNFRLLLFLDFYRLDENQKISLRTTFHDFLKKIKKWKDQVSQNDAKQTPSYLLENDLKLKKMKMIEMKNKIDDLQTENEQLKKKIKEITASTVSHDSSKSKDDSKIIELQKNLEVLKTENEQLKSKNKKMKDYIDKLTKAYKDLKKKIDQNTKESVSNNNSNDIFEMENKTDDLQTENEQMKKKIDDLQTENEQLKKKTEEITASNVSHDSSQSKDDSKIIELLNNLKTLQTENEQLKLDNSKMKDDLNKLTDAYKQIKKKIDSNTNKAVSNVSSSDSFEMEKKIEENAANANLHDSTQSKDKSKIAELQKENDQLKLKNNQMNDELNNLAKINSTYKQNLKSLKDENEQLKKQIDKSVKKAVSKVSSNDSFEMEKKVDDLPTENEQLEKKTEENATHTDINESAQLNYESKIEELQKENDQLKEKLDHVSTKYDTYRQIYKSLKSENEQLKDYQQKLLDGLDQLSSSFDTLKQNYTILQAENAQLKNQKDNEDNPVPPHPINHKLPSKDHPNEPTARPHLTQKNCERIKTFEENKEIVAKGFYKTSTFGLTHNIKNDYDNSIKNTKIITATEALTYDSKRKKCPKIDHYRIYSKIEVTRESTFAAAIRIKSFYKKLCVLNFASATKPGGGVLNGRNAQEESLSRQSTLYFSLVEQKKFYDYNKLHYDSFGTDYMIYSPNIYILRNDNDKLIDPIKVSVISSVAVNYSELITNYHGNDLNQKVYDVMKNRCRRILELCLAKGNEAIVLGAFGCGVFKNPPKIVSRIFKELLIDEAIGMEFKHVVFAILSKQNSSDELFKVFYDTFEYSKAI